MKSLKKKDKIAIILPYKEIYSNNHSGAASIWVKDYFSRSILSNVTYIYGSLEKKLKPITKNFINLNINDLSFSIGLSSAFVTVSDDTSTFSVRTNALVI